jgi:regulator of sigma E protease
MNILIQIGQLILSLSILIILHEFGHFLFAKLFKTKVEKFYLFFNPWFSLFKIKKGETEYGIGWLPLGGYVKISGMIDESMDTEQLKQPPQPLVFRYKPAWQRLFIMLGGVLVNVFLAFMIYSLILFTWGQKYLPNKNVTDGIWITDSIMYDAGLRNGDKVISINDKIPEDFANVSIEMIYGGKVLVNRNGKDTTLDWPKDFIGRLVEKSIHKKGILIYPRIPFIVNGFSDSSLNKTSGLAQKDIILEVNNKPIKYFDEFILMADSLKGQKVPFIVLRDGQRISLILSFDKNGKIGVASGIPSYDQLEKLGYYQFVSKKYGFFQSIPAGFHRAQESLASYIRQINLIFHFKNGAYKGVGGIGAIGGLFPPVWDWQAFWEITAFLSIMLAFINVLPIPALDGGHVAFLAFEMITRRKPSDKFLEYAQYVGMIIVLFLVLFSNGNDIYRKILQILGK